MYSSAYARDEGIRGPRVPVCRLCNDGLQGTNFGEPGARSPYVTDDYVVVATQHKGDHESMDRCLRSPVGYVALIASRKRSKLVLDYLRRRGFSDDNLAKVYAPAGLDLHARTADEIALATLSEIVMLRRRGTSAHRRDVSQKTNTVALVA